MICDYMSKAALDHSHNNNHGSVCVCVCVCLCKILTATQTDSCNEQYHKCCVMLSPSIIMATSQISAHAMQITR